MRSYLPDEQGIFCFAQMCQQGSHLVAKKPPVGIIDTSPEARRARANFIAQK
jgi:hypothetical protein